MASRYQKSVTFCPVRIGGALVLAAACLVAMPLKAGEVEQVFVEVEDSLGVPALQAIISSCLGELIFLTGTTHIVVKDGVATQFNWQGMIGETLDGDLFVGGSGAGGVQSNLTLAEVGAGPDGRLVHLSIVDGVLSVVCH